MSEVSSAAPVADTSVDTGSTEVQATEEKVNTPPPSLKEKFKLTVDGEEIEDELDWNDKDAIKQRLQLAAAAKKRMGEASEAKRKAYEIVSQFEKDPQSMLKRLGPKGREIAEQYLLADIQEQMLSPEEKESRDAKRERDELKKEKEERLAKEKSDIESKKEFELAQGFQNTIITALEKSGLPKSPELVKRMAKIMHKNLDYGLDLTPDELVVEVKKETTSTLKSIIANADGEQLIALFGEDIAKKIRMADVKKLKEKSGQLFPESGGNKGGGLDVPKNDSKPMSMDEWKAEVNRRIGN